MRQSTEMTPPTRISMLCTALSITPLFTMAFAHGKFLYLARSQRSL